MNALPSLSAEQENELKRLKSYFPYRYCFAALNQSTGEFKTFAVFNYPAKKMQKLRDNGFTLYELSK